LPFGYTGSVRPLAGLSCVDASAYHELRTCSVIPFTSRARIAVRGVVPPVAPLAVPRLSSQLEPSFACSKTPNARRFPKPAPIAK